jgi:hypothetical protein
MFSGFLDHGILQPTGVPHRDAAGGDQGPQGLGPGQCHLPESGHQVNSSNVFLPGRRGLGSTDCINHQNKFCGKLSMASSPTLVDQGPQLLGSV